VQSTSGWMRAWRNLPAAAWPKPFPWCRETRMLAIEIHRYKARAISGLAPFSVIAEKIVSARCASAPSGLRGTPSKARLTSPSARLRGPRGHPVLRPKRAGLCRQ
jgi:hypothetical protein